MKKINLNIFRGLVILLLFTLASCSKDRPDGPDKLGGNASITMDVDGKPWKAMYSYMLTTPPDEDGDDYIIGVVGSDVDLTKADDDPKHNGLNLFIAIPKSKFRNPVGVYDVRAAWSDDKGGGLVSAWFLEVQNSETIAYWPFYDQVSGATPIVGTVSITKFEIGNQKLQTQENFEGYTKLSGTFSMNLTKVQNSSGSFENVELKITNGKFDLKSGIDLGGLFFGKAPEMLARVKRNSF